MLADPSTYAIEDFIPFTAEVYLRLVERQNTTMWPAHFVALAAGLAAMACAWRGWGRGRPLAVLLAASWGWVAWSFHVRVFSELTWAANVFAGAFALQAVLTLAAAWLGGFNNEPHRKPGAVRILGVALAAAGLVGFPLLALRNEHGWAAAETFAMTPDPTVVVTLALLLLAARPLAYLALLPIPLLWCAIASVIEWTLDTPFAWIMPAVASVLAITVIAEAWVAWRTKRQ
ncbi:MAG: DUF6064 family protein [Phycisphaeraceae bacterium]